MRVRNFKRKERKAEYVPTDMIKRWASMPTPTSLAFTSHTYLPVEFDITCLNPSASTGRQYVMEWTNGFGSGTEYAVQFTDMADLQYKLTNHIDIVLLSGISMRYGTIYWDVATSLFYFIAMYTTTEGGSPIHQLRGLSGATLLDLKAKMVDEPTLLANSNLVARNFSDPTLRKLSDGRFILTGHNGAEPFIWTNTNPIGTYDTWTKHGTIFKNAARNQHVEGYQFEAPADVSLLIDGDDVYCLMNGFSYDHISASFDGKVTSHMMMVQLDPANDFTIMAKPASPLYQRIFLDGQLKSLTSTNPVPILEEDGWKIYSSYTTITGEGGMVKWEVPNVASPVDEIMFNPKWANIYNGGDEDKSTQIQMVRYGTTSIEVDGMKVSGNDSGVYGFVGNMNMTDFAMTYQFTLDALPATGQVGCLVSIVGTKNNVPFEVTVLPDGKLMLNGIFHIGSVTVGFNELKINKKKNALTCGNFSTFLYDFDSCFYTLFNKGTDVITTGKQVNGTIHHFSIRLLNYEPIAPCVTSITGNASDANGTTAVHTVHLSNANGGALWFSMNSLGSGVNVVGTRTFSNGVKMYTQRHQNISQSILVPKGVSEFTINTPLTAIGYWLLFVDTVCEIYQST